MDARLFISLANPANVWDQNLIIAVHADILGYGAWPPVEYLLIA